MKLNKRIDKEIDENEIESKYIWNFQRDKTIRRANLFELSIDFSKQSSIPMINYLTIPNNKIFGVKLGGLDSNLRQLFILDEYFNLKIIETSKIQPYNNRCLSSCFYDDSIFTFEKEYNSDERRSMGRNAKRYLLSQNRWIYLPGLHFYPCACIGFKQKIIIATHSLQMIIYDIYLNSYSTGCPSISGVAAVNQMMVKKSGKIYLIVETTNAYKIYSCEDPSSNWTFVYNSEEKLFGKVFFPHTYYKSSVYYFRDPNYYEFSLETFRTKEIILKNLKIY